MLPPKENELITRVGPGTPMGNAMRRYWIPACLSREIAEPDCPPVRVRLLGEDLVAFRDTEGRIGLVDEFCPHRRVSLYFGRNEECGLRCVYHGWKFDVDGNCVDQLNEPPEHQFKQHIQLTAYPTVELGGLVWAYLGPADKMPPPPKFAWTQVPRKPPARLQGHRGMQLAAGAGRRHRHLARADPAPPADRQLDARRHQAVEPVCPRQGAEARRRRHRLRLSLCRHPAARRRGDVHVRSYHFIMPFHQIRPSRSESGIPSDAGHIWVPIDDYNCMVYNWMYSTDRCAADRGRPARARHRQRPGFRRPDDVPLVPEPVEQLRPRPRGAEHRELHRHRRHQPAGPRLAGKHGADRRPLEGASRPGRQGDQPDAADAARSGQDGQEGGDPAGTGTSYYHIRAGEEVLPARCRLARVLAPDITKDKILQTV